MHPFGKPAGSYPALDRDIPLWMLYPLLFVAVYLSHVTLLRLPYFWDEAGYYIPAAWDFFRTGTLIPHTTVTNAHPPLPSILLAAWWHVSGYVISGTRTFVCMVSAAALLGVYKLARSLAGNAVAAVTTVLTAIYPVWFAQSTLAHADIFAAVFTVWGLAFYLEPAAGFSAAESSAAGRFAPEFTAPPPAASKPDDRRTSSNRILAALLFSLAALSKETAIITPAALALWESAQWLRRRPPNAPNALHAPDAPDASDRQTHARWTAALLLPIVPLAAWYAFHYHRTGFIFGNPEFLRYNATANLDAHRIALCLWHRLLHLTMHMNLFVPVVCALAVVLIPIATTAAPPGLPRRALRAIAVVLIANWIAFSILGGALLTRYLLPMYPLILLVSVALWQRHLRRLWPLAALSAAAFLSALWINPPYAFAPEDNLTYRDMIVLHVQAIHFIEQHYPQATVLTAWPATSELSRPEIGYARRPIRTSAAENLFIDNFSLAQLQRAAADPGAFDTALLFSTKWEPPADKLNLGSHHEPADIKYFDFHHDLLPAEAAALLGGEIVWQAHRKGEWAAVLRFPRIVNASIRNPIEPLAALAIQRLTAAQIQPPSSP